MGIDVAGRGADLDNVFIAANYHAGDRNPLNPDNALVRYAVAVLHRCCWCVCWLRGRASGRFEFVEALVRLAMVMYPPGKTPDGYIQAV